MTTVKDPLTILREQIEASPHSMKSASVKAGLSKETISRWLAQSRDPQVEQLSKALAVFGYKLTAVPDF